MSEAFERAVSRGDEFVDASGVGRYECARARVCGQSDASGGAGAGEDDGRTAEPDQKLVDPVGRLFVPSGDYLHCCVERVGWIRCDTKWRAGR